MGDAVPMSLAELYGSINSPRIGQPCSVALLLENLDKSDREFLLGLFASDESHVKIARLLKANGTPVSDSVIGRHRRGECKCDEPG
jgi:hypothetical protein